MKVLIAVEFDGVDASSDEAHEILEQINESCESIQVGFDAQSCWVQEVFDTGEE